MDMPVETPAPPQAEQHPYSYERHGVTVEDPWHWIRDRQYPEVTDAEVLAYLTAENDYFGVWAKQNQPLMDQLFEEMKGRIKEDDSSVPMRDGDFLYWWAFKRGAQYRTWYRKPVGGGDDQIIFDEPAEAEGKEYFRLGAIDRARTASCSRRWSTTMGRNDSTCAFASSRPARTSRRSPKLALARRSGPATAQVSSSPR